MAQKCKPRKLTASIQLNTSALVDAKGTWRDGMNFHLRETRWGSRFGREEQKERGTLETPQKPTCLVISLWQVTAGLPFAWHIRGAGNCQISGASGTVPTLPPETSCQGKKPSATLRWARTAEQSREADVEVPLEWWQLAVHSNLWPSVVPKNEMVIRTGRSILSTRLEGGLSRWDTSSALNVVW